MTQGLVGWCHLRLNEYDQAIETIRAAITADPAQLESHFDLALALALKGKYSVARREYERVIELLDRKHPLQRRALLHVALADLRLTIANHLAMNTPEVQESVHLLEESRRR